MALYCFNQYARRKLNGIAYQPNAFDVLDNTEKKRFFLWPRFPITWYYTLLKQQKIELELVTIYQKKGVVVVLEVCEKPGLIDRAGVYLISPR